MSITKTLFCAACQADTQQAFAVKTNTSANQELVSQCPACKRELKWPVHASAAELRTLFDAHKEHNKGHVFVAPDGSELHPVLDELDKL